MRVQQHGAARDEACVRCGYVLRGLDEDGVCPECGLAIARTREALRRPLGMPGLARRVWRGAVVAEVEAAIGIAVLDGLMLLRVDPDKHLVAAVAIGLNTLSLWAWWLLTTPDPWMEGHGRKDHVRRRMRMSNTAACMTGVMFLLMGPIPEQGGMGIEPAWLTELKLVAALAFVITWGISMLAAVRWAWQIIAERLGERPLAPVTMCVMMVVGTSGVVIVGPAALVAAQAAYVWMLDDLRRRLGRRMRTVEMDKVSA